MNEWTGPQTPTTRAEPGVPVTGAGQSVAVPRGGGDYPESDHGELSLAGLLAILAQEWLLIAVVFAATVALVALYTLSQEPVYSTSSVVLVDPSSRRASSGGLEGMLAIGGGSRTLYNEVEILRQSVPLAERVGGRLLDEAPPSAPLAGSRDERSVAGVARAILGGRVRFAPVDERADLIRIAASSTDPREAALIANLYAEEYQRRSQENSRASVSSSRSFLEDQVEKRREELALIEGRLSDFMTREGAVALDSEGQNAVSQIASIDAAIEEARVSLEVERTALRSLEQQVETVEPGLARRIASSVENEIRVLQDRIVELELQATDYYTVDPTLRGDESRNAELEAIASRIAELRRQVSELSRQYVQEALAVGGVGSEGGASSALGYVTELKRDVIERRIRIQGLEAKLAALQGQVRRYEMRLRDIPRQTIELAQLQRQRLSTERTFLFLTEKLQEARVAEESELGYVEIIRRADVPGRPVSPKPVRNMTTGLLLGLVLGVGLALLKRTLDHRIRTPDDLRAHGFSVLGVIPDMAGIVKQNFGGNATAEIDSHTVASTLAAVLHPLSPATEAMRHLRTSIRFSLPDTQLQTLLVTSAAPAEGKTTTAMNLAVSMAQAGHRTLYVDADLRRPTGHKQIGIPRHNGLSELLFRPEPPDWDAYRRRLRVTWKHFDDEVDNLWVLPAGKAVPSPAELLGSQRLRDLVAEMRQAFDVVIFDTPPALAVTDPVLVATLCDAAILVAVARDTNWTTLERAQEHLAVTGTPVIGVVLNRSAGRSSGGYGYGYGYAYGYTADEVFTTDAATGPRDAS